MLGAIGYRTIIHFDDGESKTLTIPGDTGLFVIKRGQNDDACAFIKSWSVVYILSGGSELYSTTGTEGKVFISAYERNLTIKNNATASNYSIIRLVGGGI